MIDNILIHRADVHQHVWTTPLLDALASRDTVPFVRRSKGTTVLHCRGEQPYIIQTDAEAPERRAQLVHADGLDVAFVALSSVIGVEALERPAARDLIDAHLEGVGALPREFAAWGPLPLDDLDPDDVDRLLAQGCIGVSLPATALLSRARLAAAGPVLERIASRGAPLFVHPGLVATDDPHEASLAEPRGGRRSRATWRRCRRRG